MKARLPKGTVFVWGRGDLAGLAAFFRGQGIPCRFLPPDGEGKPLAELLGLAGEEAPLETGGGEQVIFFQGLSGRELDQALAGLRKQGLGQDALKAVATAQNLSWTLGALVEELCREREAFWEGRGGRHG